MSEKLGATGQFPEGKASPDDEGELKLAIGVDRMFNVRIDFGKPVTWLSFGPEQAVELGNMLLAQGMWAMEHRNPSYPAETPRPKDAQNEEVRNDVG